jgi:hypothetical protein
VRVIDDRANLLDVSRLAEEAALDHYAYVRDAYLQRRRSLIYDGNPPPEPNPDKTSDSGADPESVVGAGTELLPAQIVTQWGERVTTGADEVLTPAREFAHAQPLAAMQDSAAAAANSAGPEYVPGIAYDHELLPAVSAGVRTGLLQTGLKP